MRKIPIIILTSLLLGSCLSTKVKVNTIYTNGVALDTINLLSTMIGPLWQPVLPLIDAAAFNGKTNKISDLILDEEQKIIESYKAILVSNLTEKLKKGILTGSDFTSEPANRYKVGNSLQVDSKNFPVVFFSKGDLNIVDFGSAKNINSIFKDNQQIKAGVIKLATDLKLKTVLLSYNRLSVVNAGMFGATGNLRLESYLFLYRANGDLLIDAYGWTKPTAINGKELSDYKFQLDNFQELANLMSQQLTSYIK